MRIDSFFTRGHVARRHRVEDGNLVFIDVCQRPRILVVGGSVPLLVHEIGDRGTVLRGQGQLLILPIDCEAFVGDKRVDIAVVVHAHNSAPICGDRLSGCMAEVEVRHVDADRRRHRGERGLRDGRSCQSAFRHSTHVGVAIIIGVLGEVGHLIANFLRVPFSVYGNVAQKLHVGGSLLGAFGVEVPTVKGVAFFDGSRVGSHRRLGGVAGVIVLGMVVGANPFPSLEYPIQAFPRISLAAPTAVGRGFSTPGPIARLRIVNMQRPGARQLFLRLRSLAIDGLSLPVVPRLAFHVGAAHAVVGNRKNVAVVLNLYHGCTVSSDGLLLDNLGRETLDSLNRLGIGGRSHRAGLHLPQIFAHLVAVGVAQTLERMDDLVLCLHSGHHDRHNRGSSTAGGQRHCSCVSIVRDLGAGLVN